MLRSLPPRPCCSLLSQFRKGALRQGSLTRTKTTKHPHHHEQLYCFPLSLTLTFESLSLDREACPSSRYVARRWFDPSLLLSERSSRCDFRQDQVLLSSHGRQRGGCSIGAPRLTSSYPFVSFSPSAFFSSSQVGGNGGVPRRTRANPIKSWFVDDTSQAVSLPMNARSTCVCLVWCTDCVKGGRILFERSRFALCWNAVGSSVVVLPELRALILPMNVWTTACAS